MSTEADYLKVLKNIRTASYAFNVPTLALWTGLFARLLFSKDRNELLALIVICFLLILSQIASIVYWQLTYTFADRFYNGDLRHQNLARQIICACAFTSNTTFNLAHWLFAFSYLTLSYQLELISKELPVRKYSCPLNTVNAIVCLVNVAIQAVVWVFFAQDNIYASNTASDID